MAYIWHMPIVPLLLRLRNLCGHNASFRIPERVRNQERIASDLFDLIISKIIRITFNHYASDKLRI